MYKGMRIYRFVKFYLYIGINRLFVLYCTFYKINIVIVFRFTMRIFAHIKLFNFT